MENKSPSAETLTGPEYLGLWLTAERAQNTSLLRTLALSRAYCHAIAFVANDSRYSAHVGHVITTVHKTELLPTNEHRLRSRYDVPGHEWCPLCQTNCFHYAAAAAQELDFCALAGPLPRPTADLCYGCGCAIFRSEVDEKHSPDAIAVSMRSRVTVYKFYPICQPCAADPSVAEGVQQLRAAEQERLQQRYQRQTKKTRLVGNKE